MKVIKEVVGIDVAKDELVFRLGTKFENSETLFSQDLIVENNLNGFKILLKKVESLSKSKVKFVMEATGSYQEKLAFYLISKKQDLSIVLASRAKAYGRSLEFKSKTDKIDAKILAMMGLERALIPWEAPSPLMIELKAMTRLRKSFVDTKVEYQNKLHAKEVGYSVNQNIKKHLRKMIEHFNKEITKIEESILKLVKSDSEIYDNIRRVSGIKGVGEMSLIIIIAETDCFKLFSSMKQVASYSGLDVVLSESGKKARKSKISKKGNKYIRTALFMCALSASRYNKQMKQFKDRINERNSIKKVAITAISRKLLTLIYTIWISGE